MSQTQREMLLWIGGALFIAAAVLAWMWLSQPADNALPTQYGFGIL